MTKLIVVQGEPIATVVFEPKVHRGDVVLVHGFTGSKEDFSDCGPMIAKHGYRVLTLDNRGQHESPHSKREDAYTIKSLARDAIDMAQLLGMTNPHLLGHSFGGLVSQRAVLMEPNYWKSLTLMCSGPAAIGFREEMLSHEVLMSIPMEKIWDDHMAAMELGKPAYEMKKKRWAMSDARSVATHRRHLIDEPSIVKEVRATGISAHVVYGENDDAWPLPLQDQMAKDLEAQLDVIPGAGHCPNEDTPELLTDVLVKFWDKN
jgi:pimeloyl-ACP methyl ester carboxylesterase